MAKRYPLSGYNDDAMTAKTTVYSCINTLGVQKLGVTTGRVFWLRGLVVTNEHATTGGAFELWDQAEAATPAAGTAANQRLTVYIGPTETVALDFPAPGIKFITGVSGSAEATMTVNAYGVQCTGYEE